MVLGSLEILTIKRFSDDCIGEKTEGQCSDLKPGEVILLENLRFYKEEINADESFAKKLSNLAEIYVNDAYGTTHREHASTATMAKFFDLKSPGILLETGKKIGWNFIDEKDSRELFSSFKKIFNKLKEDVLNGKEFKIPTPDSNRSENKPMNKKLFERDRAHLTWT